ASDNRSTSMSASRSLAYDWNRTPPSDGPSAVECTAMIPRRPTFASAKKTTCSCPRAASNSVTSGAGPPVVTTIAAYARLVEPSVRLTTWHGEPAVELRSGALTATFLPNDSMLGVSFTHEGEALLAPIATLAQYRAGHTTGIPLLHAW